MEDDIFNFRGKNQVTENFYRKNHIYQTFDFAMRKKKEYELLNRRKIDIWSMIESLDDIVDESDPDLDCPQSFHAFQVAEAMRRNQEPDWFILTGLIHDLGKILILFGEPQWAVVGDIFPVGCAWSPKIVYSQYFKDNPDTLHPIYSTTFGIYQPNCGLDAVHFSFSHDWYLSTVLKNQSNLPYEAIYMIKYHSFYAYHTESDYLYLTDKNDYMYYPWLAKFKGYDLYTKKRADQGPNDSIHNSQNITFYQKLIHTFIPGMIRW